MQVLGNNNCGVIFRAAFLQPGGMNLNMTKSVQREYEMLALFELTPDFVCIAGKDGYFKMVNPAVIKTLQYEPEELYSRPIFSFLHPDDYEQTDRGRLRLMEGKPLLNFQNRYLAKNGETVWLEWTSVYIPDKEIVFAIAKNITENKLREEDFKAKMKTYQNMVHEYRNRAEEDRRTLAHELHEELAQLAAALKWQTEVVQNRIEGLPADTVSKLGDIVTISESLVKAIRRLSFSVSPSMLFDLGFNETMEYACQEFTMYSGIPCEYQCDLEEEIEGEVKTNLFRNCQQALSLIARQVDVNSVNIRLLRSLDGTAVDIQREGGTTNILLLAGSH